VANAEPLLVVLLGPTGSGKTSLSLALAEHFEFSEDAVLSAGEAEEANLKYLAGLGFRLSMDQVTTLDLDFAKLKRLGFEFVKVRASTLIYGMSRARALVAAEDFKDLLARNGINLIAERE